MIRPTAAAMLLLFGVLATIVSAAVPDATSKKDGNLRGLANKIVSPLKNQIYQPTKTIDPAKTIDPDYNPTMPPETPMVPGYNPTRPHYNPTRPAPYNPTRPSSF